MGQKVNPIGFRLGITKDWKAKWYADKKNYPKTLHEDIAIREYIQSGRFILPDKDDKRKNLQANFVDAGIGDVIIERLGEKLRIKIYAVKPGIVIGKGGSNVERLNEKLKEITGAKEIIVNVDEIRKPQLNAKIVAQDIALQLERRVSHRRAMKRAVDMAMKEGAKGIKVQVGGRIGGVDLARKEWIMEGRMPLQTLRADIDYGTARAYTKYGILGIKVWIYKGDKLSDQKDEIVKRIEEKLSKI